MLHDPGSSRCGNEDGARPIIDQKADYWAPSVLPSEVVNSSPNLQEDSTKIVTQDGLTQDGGAVFSEDKTLLEYSGPQTFLSIGSKLAVNWVTDKLGNSHFRPVATHFARETVRRLNTAKRISPDRKGDPSPQMAWRYTISYFDQAQEALFGVILRSSFEAKLEAHLAGSNDDDESPAWYALRNAVFASGCRILVAKHSGFNEAVAESSGWFENALSVLSDILYRQSSLLGVQALVVMAYYCEGIGGPNLQWMLTSCAIRLACARGLHRQPSSSWKIAEGQIRHRTWLFWAAYCLERYIAARSGRPPAVDDDEISCHIPSTIPAESAVGLWYCKFMVEISWLLSQAGKSLSSAAAMRRSLGTLILEIQHLDRKLEALKEFIRHIVALDKPFDPFSLPIGQNSTLVLRLYFLYYEVALRIHSALSQPWLRSIWGQKQCEVQMDQIQRSHDITISISRAVVQTTAHVRIDATSTLPTVLTLPMAALVNIFLNILRDSSLPSTQTDLALLDVGAGHFARVEVNTDSQYSVTFARHIANIARSFCDNVTPPLTSTSVTDKSSSLAQNTWHDSEAHLSMTGDLPAYQVTDQSLYSDMQWLDFDQSFDWDMWNPLHSAGIDCSPDDLL